MTLKTFINALLTKPPKPLLMEVDKTHNSRELNPKSNSAKFHSQTLQKGNDKNPFSIKICRICLNGSLNQTLQKSILKLKL